jgi:hypothetical protein
MTDDPNRPLDDDEGEVRVYDAPARPTGSSGTRLVWIIVVIVIIILLLYWIF